MTATAMPTIVRLIEHDWCTVMYTQEELNKQKEENRLAAERHYAACARIKTLPPEVHEHLRQLALRRHDLHCNGEEIFFRTEEGRSQEKDILLTLNWLKQGAKKYPELMPAENVALYFVQMTSAGTTYQLDPSKKEECIASFVEAKERVNEIITKLLKAVDKKHYTRYAPAGMLRYGRDDSKKKSSKKLKWLMEQYSHI